MSVPVFSPKNEIEAEQKRFPRRIVALCTLTGVSILGYTILVMTNHDRPLFDTWFKNSQSVVDAVYSMHLTRTNLVSYESASALGDKLAPMVHVYAFSWIIGLFFFTLLFVTSLVRLRDYYVAVSLPSYPKDKPLIDHIAWKWGGILGCWAGAAYGGELYNIFSRTLFASSFIPLMFYFILAFVASLLAHFRFRRLKPHDLSPQ